MPRALLVTYHFPPGTAAGANRWDAFTRYASQTGWQFDVISAVHAQDPGTYVAGVKCFGVEESSGWVERFGRSLNVLKRYVKKGSGTKSGGFNSNQISDQTVPASNVRWSLTPSGLRQAYSVWVLHARMHSWMRNAVSTGLRLVQSHAYDVVISSGPPHLAHEAARVIASKAGIPFVCDFRDPWAQIDVLQSDVASPLYYRLSQRFEGRVVQSARLVCMNTEPAANAMRREYPEAKIAVVRNGFDQVAPAAQHGSTFLVLYAGAVYLDRDPRPLLKAASAAIGHLNLGPTDFQLHFIGPTDSFGGIPLGDLAESYGIGDYVVVSGKMSRTALLERMTKAALLVNLPQGAKLCIPSKVYEYLHMPAWILAMENHDSATAELLAATSAHVVSPDDVAAITDVLVSRIQDYRKGMRPSATVSGDEFTAARQAELFFREVSTMLADDGG